MVGTDYTYAKYTWAALTVDAGHDTSDLVNRVYDLDKSIQWITAAKEALLQMQRRDSCVPRMGGGEEARSPVTTDEMMKK